MSRERELLQRALAVLGQVRLTDHFDFDLEDDIRAELQKPEPCPVGWIEKQNGVFLSGWDLNDIENGKYKLYAVRIDDDQKI
jgi:hypothetical protein